MTMMRRGMTLGDTLGALKNMSPGPSPHRPKMYRSNSFTSRTEVSRRSRHHDVDSVMFHDDNTIFSNYDYSLAGSLAGHSKGDRRLSDLLANGQKPVNTDDLHDSFSLYTSNTPVPTEEELLEEAIRKGAALASQEDQDTVVSMKDFSKYRTSLMKEEKEKTPAAEKPFTLEMEPEEDDDEEEPTEAPLIDRWGSNSHMRHHQQPMPEQAPPPPQQQQQQPLPSEESLRDRKMHRQQSRRALAERKTGRKFIQPEDDDESEAIVSQSSRVSKRHSVNGSSTRSNTNSTTNNKRSHMHKSCSQPSVMSSTQSMSTWDPEASIPTITAGNLDPPPPKTHRTRGRPPVTKTHRGAGTNSTCASASACGQDSLNDDSVCSSSYNGEGRGRRGRSRSVGRALKTVTRSLSRVRNYIRGSGGGDTTSEDEENKAASSKRKKECTCPAEDVMLTSCPRHGEKAAKILAKRKAKEEKKEKERIKKEQAKKAKEEKKQQRNNNNSERARLGGGTSRRGRGRTGRLSASLHGGTNADDNNSAMMCQSYTTDHARRRSTAAEC